MADMDYVSVVCESLVGINTKSVIMTLSLIDGILTVSLSDHFQAFQPC